MSNSSGFIDNLSISDNDNHSNGSPIPKEEKIPERIGKQNIGLKVIRKGRDLNLNSFKGSFTNTSGSYCAETTIK